MDLSFWADVYAVIFAAIGRWSFVIVFLIGGGLASGLWWGVGKSYDRQQQAILKVEATEKELNRLSSAVAALQQPRPVEVKLPPMPPIQTVVKNEPLKPLISVQNTRVIHDAAKRRVDVGFVLRNSTATPAVAKIAFELFLNGRQIANVQTTHEIIGGTDGERLELSKDVTFTDDSAHRLWVTNATPLNVKLTIQYSDGEKQVTYVVEGAVSADSNGINITKNERTTV